MEENVSRLHRQAIRPMAGADYYFEMTVVRREFNLLLIAYTNMRVVRKNGGSSNVYQNSRPVSTKRALVAMEVF
jgi:hypothetical protein